MTVIALSEVAARLREDLGELAQPLGWPGGEFHAGQRFIGIEDAPEHAHRLCFGERPLPASSGFTASGDPASWPAP